jgi:hypothetical protein
MARLIPSAALALVLLALASPAADAAICWPTLTDGDGRTYELAPQGDVTVGPGYLGLAYLTPEWTADYSHAPDECEMRLGGQEVVYPEEEIVGWPGLWMAPRVYVPASGTPFVRHLFALRNRGAAPITVPLHHYVWVKGGAAVRVAATSDGDLRLGPEDLWGVLGDPGGGPWLALVTQGPAPGRRTGVTDVYDWAGVAPAPLTDGMDEAHLRYDEIRLAPGERVLVALAAAVRPTAAEAAAAGRALAALPSVLFAGLTAEERAAIVNVPPPADGAPAADPAAPADGAPAADPAAPAEGAPAADPAAPAEGAPGAGTAAPADTVAPRLRIAAVRRFRAARLRGHGLRVRVQTAEPAALTVELTARARRRGAGARVARAELPAASGRRVVRLRVGTRLRTRTRTLVLRVVATDASGNAARAARLIRLRP